MRDLVGRLQALDATISRSAQLGDDRQLVLAAEHLLRLHVEFARTCRTWRPRLDVGVSGPAR
jgi:hypothetical protein